jgi:hypothetical protein
MNQNIIQVADFYEETIINIWNINKNHEQWEFLE